MQPMPQSICAYVCVYVCFGPCATSPARGDRDWNQWVFRPMKRSLIIYKLGAHILMWSYLLLRKRSALQQISKWHAPLLSSSSLSPEIIQVSILVTVHEAGKWQSLRVLQVEFAVMANTFSSLIPGSIECAPSAYCSAVDEATTRGKYCMYARFTGRKREWSVKVMPGARAFADFL
jgi:hypothetical protein